MLVSYVAKLKPDKNVLLSTMHTRFTVPETVKGKENTKKIPEIIDFYNCTMAAVDSADQMVRRYSC